MSRDNCHLYAAAAAAGDDGGRRGGGERMTDGPRHLRRGHRHKRLKQMTYGAFLQTRLSRYQSIVVFSNLAQLFANIARWKAFYIWIFQYFTVQVEICIIT